jgi:Rps23 Pro-64 3,4-dihydroxylase Tpa1-like proline 4-hydroxylase
MYYNKQSLLNSLKTFKDSKPFDHCVIDDFLLPDVAKAIESEFIDYTDSRWMSYKNALEDKKALNDWNAFPQVTYNLFRELISERFLNILGDTLGVRLYQDPGLHGGGWHVHGAGGNLNPHFDYSIHPKVGLQRKINLIIYVSTGLLEKHGGHLGFWTHDPETMQPKDLLKIIQPKFNRAVIFDTTQNSWHGLCRPLTQPPGVYRKSLAVYYLTDPPMNVDLRQRALFAPREDQKGDLEIESLIKKRADPNEYASVYRTISAQLKQE